MGQGKFGKVYRAKAKHSNQTYAIKMILKVKGWMEATPLVTQ